MTVLYIRPRALHIETENHNECCLLLLVLVTTAATVPVCSRRHTKYNTLLLIHSTVAMMKTLLHTKRTDCMYDELCGGRPHHLGSDEIQNGGRTFSIN